MIKGDIMSQEKTDYFEFIKTDKTPRPHRVSTNLSEEEKKNLEFRRIIAGHKSNAAYLRQLIVYADLWDEFISTAEYVSDIKPGSQPIDIDEGVKKLWEVIREKQLNKKDKTNVKQNKRI